MNEQWSLINFQELLESILDGKRAIEDPIDIFNKRRDTSSKISFLNLLLNYNNIHKDNLLETLHKIYSMFQRRMDTLKNDEIIQVMLDRIHNEWYQPDFLFVVQNPLSRDFFQRNNLNDKKYDHSCKLCKDLDHLSQIENNIPTNLNENESHPLETHFKTTILTCEETAEYIRENITEIQSILQYFRDFDLTMYIDLSIKHKSLYLILNDKEDHDGREIPESIHKIFSNFIHIHNLFYKQITQYYHHLLELLEDLEKKCSSMKKQKQSIESIAYIQEGEEEEEEEGEGEEEVDGGEEEEGLELYVTNNEIKTRVKENQEGGAINKFLSFF